ncbi:hypothetical protein [uncultured Nonlabens sp.]|uniref:hypothetical protein n=1 Tax=uncultured Nonlabens sp. TaxID=859306 RepID=UPI002604AC98|nr:hypothetical protein [uncultured Nonlabens sp.]
MKDSIFKGLNPASTLLLIESNPSLLSLMKAALFDLMHKQVLTVKKEEKKLNPRDKYYRVYTVVETGVNFSSYKPNTFESYFIDKVNEDSYFILISFLRTVYSNIHSRYDFSTKVIKSGDLSPYFNLNYFFYIFSYVYRKVNGKTRGKQLKNRLNEIDTTIKDDLINNKSRVYDMVQELGSNVFLLEHMDFSLLKNYSRLESNTSSMKNEILDDYSWLEIFMDDSYNVFDNIITSSSFDYEPDFDF